MTARGVTASVFIALLLWPSMVAAQNQTTDQPIADAIVQFCRKGGGTHTIAVDGANISIRTFDIRRDAIGEYNIPKSSVDGIVGSINKAVPQQPIKDSYKVRACLQDFLNELLDVPEPLSRPLLPARVYLRSKDIPPPAVGAYGVVALRSKPTSASRSRLLKMCSAYIAHLPRSEPLLPSVPIQDQMLTIWPLDDPGAQGAVSDDCKFVLDHYDLYGGFSAIQDAERQGANLNGRGPFLIGWSPSSSRGIPDKIVLVVDLSSLESQDSFDTAFLFWQRKVIEDPTLWRSGFSLEVLRLAIRDFVDHYGQAVISTATVWGARK